MKLLIVTALMLVSISGVFAQSATKKYATSKDNTVVDRSASFTTEKRKVKKRKSKYSIAGQYDKKVEEYEKRMKDNARKHKKMAKEMEKPQYSDPTYFGHKRKPKKRPPGKKKFCKECGLYH